MSQADKSIEEVAKTRPLREFRTSLTTDELLDMEVFTYFDEEKGMRRFYIGTPLHLNGQTGNYHSFFKTPTPFILLGSFVKETGPLKGVELSQLIEVVGEEREKIMEMYAVFDSYRKEENRQLIMANSAYVSKDPDRQTDFNTLAHTS